MNLILTVLGALVAGVALGGLHMGLLRYAVERATATSSPLALALTAPLRIALPALGLAASALFGPLALGGCLLGYVVSVQLIRWRALPCPRSSPA